MTTLLWILQALLAFAFLMSGMIKLLQPKEKLLEMMAVLAPFSESTIKGIGLLEVLGAIGVILPVILGVMPGVVPWAAAGLALTMIGAGIAHSRRGEWPMVGMNVMLFLMAGYVAMRHWGMEAA